MLFRSEDLVEKVIETTGAVDKNGKPVKVTKYVLKYPETVIPPVENSAENVTTSEVDTTSVSETELPETELNESNNIL